MPSLSHASFAQPTSLDAIPPLSALVRQPSRKRSRVEARQGAPAVERKLVAILAADVEGYSRLMHDDEEAALATLAAHRGIIDSLVSARGGSVKGSAGDGVLAEFPSIVEAVECGVSIQQALARANHALPTEQRMAFRIGINVGDVMVHGGDVYGDGVNIAARLEGLAPAGGICVSRSVRDHIRDRVAYGFDDLGEQRVKNISRPLRVFRIVFDPEGASSTAPSLAPPPIPVTPNLGGSDPVEISFWQSADAGGTSADYEAYLAQYPHGAFAALAHARLAAEPPTACDHAVELAFWASVKDSDNPEMFMAYLEKFPDGEFASLAEIRKRQTGAPGSLASLSGLLKAAFSGEPTLA